MRPGPPAAGPPRPAGPCCTGARPAARRCHTLGVQPLHANRSSPSPLASGLRVLRQGVRRRLPTWPPTSVLQSVVSTARLRASARLFARAHRASASRPSPRRDVEWHRLRAQPHRIVRRVRSRPRHANIGTPRRPPAGNAVRRARRPAPRPPLQHASASSVQDVHVGCILQSVAFRHHRVERTLPTQGHARRDSRATHRSE